MKKFALLIALLSTSLVNAGEVFDGRVSNPFSFCSAPRPCDKCQPARSIYDTICKEGDKNKYPQLESSVTPEQRAIAQARDASNNTQILKQAMDADSSFSKATGTPQQFGVLDIKNVQSSQSVMFNGQPSQLITTQTVETKLINGDNGQYVKKDFVTNVSRTLNGQPIDDKQYQSIMSSAGNGSSSQQSTGGRLF